MEDCEIIRLYFDRDESAIRETALKYGPYCGVVALNILGNVEEADECVNDTYLKAWENIPPQRPLSLGAFLCRITKNLAINRVRSANGKKRINREVSFDELENDLPSDGDTVENEFDRGEILRAINDFLRTLPDKKQRIFIGRYWAQCSISSLAKSFHMTEAGISLSLQRTRKKLKAYLRREGFDV